ncbi:MAG: DUF3502 domain-containing protein [Ruminiclostridium sp.]|nr:DUF3502 domain-containing protein [Ruminiclostridium sp.]
MKVKKLIALLLASMLVFGLAACGTQGQNQTGSTTTAGSTTAEITTAKPPEPYTIKFMTAGPTGKQADSEKVLALVNTKLPEFLPNTTLDFEVIPFGEYKEKWQLAAAAGEKVDIAWIGWMMSLQDEVNNGSYLPLDEPIAQFAPALKDTFPDWVWENTKVKGKIYTVPVGLGWSNAPAGLVFPAALTDKYLDLEAYNKAQMEWEKSGSYYPTESFLDALESFLAKAKAGGDLNLGIQHLAVPTSWFSTGSSSFTKQRDESSKAYSFLDEDLSYFFTRMAKWYKEGYIRKDALTSTDMSVLQPTGGSYKDKLIMVIDNVDSNTQGYYETKWGMPATVLKMQSTPKTPIGKLATALAISRTSGNVERALKLIELLDSEKGADITNLLAYGIEGEHYAVTTPKVAGVKGSIIHTFGYNDSGDGGADSKYGVPTWTIAYDRYAAKNQGYKATVVEDALKQDADAIKVPLTGFQYDPTAVKLEQAQFSAIYKEYMDGLLFGTYPDPIKTYNEMKKRLEAAGVRKIAEDLQKQIDAFKAIK